MHKETYGYSRWLLQNKNSRLGGQPFEVGRAMGISTVLGTIVFSPTPLVFARRSHLCQIELAPRKTFLLTNFNTLFGTDFILASGQEYVVLTWT